MAIPVLFGGAVFLLESHDVSDTQLVVNEAAATTTTLAATATSAVVAPTTAVTATVVTVPTPAMLIQAIAAAPPPANAVPTATLPEQPSQPIDPPLDPRAAEVEIKLGQISIPKLGVSEPLYSGIRLTTLDNGPGHWPGTAMPGQVGNVVVAGHRTSHGAPFRDLDQLVAGDIVQFETGNGPIDYFVTGTQVVGPEALWIVDPTDTPTATLFACHPPGSASQRIVVHLELA